MKRLKVFVMLMVMMLLLSPLKGDVYGATIKLNKTSASIAMKQTLQLKVTGTKKKVKWSSSKKSVAKVTSKGKVTGVKTGKATITAAVGKKKLKCKITVTKSYQLKLNLHHVGTNTGIYTGKLNKKGLPNGQGTFVSKDGEGETWTYKGQWKNGQMEGQGCTVWNNGNNKEEGTYKDSDFVKGKMWNNCGVLSRVGEFKDGMLHGQGTLYNKKGQAVYSGSFKKEVPVDKNGFKNACKEMTYNDLARNPDNYMGDLVKISGTVIDVEKDDEDIEYTVAFNDNYNKLMDCYVYKASSSITILEDDEVTIYASYWGTFDWNGDEYLDLFAYIITLN